VLDDQVGLLDTYEGRFEGDELVVTNLKSGTTWGRQERGRRSGSRHREPPAA